MPNVAATAEDLIKLKNDSTYEVYHKTCEGRISYDAKSDIFSCANKKAKHCPNWHGYIVDSNLYRQHQVIALGNGKQIPKHEDFLAEHFYVFQGGRPMIYKLIFDPKGFHYTREMTPQELDDYYQKFPQTFNPWINKTIVLGPP